MRKRVLVLAANPKADSFVNTLADTYARSARQKHDVKLLNLADMTFNVDLADGYTKDQPLEDSLKAFQAALTWCEHLVIFTPNWWGALPAKLKGLIDRTFLPGFAFQYEKGMSIPKKLLQGKTTRIVMTMDTPPWYYVLFQGAPAIRQLKTATLKFVGFGAVTSRMIGPIISSTNASREKWLNEMSKLGLSAS
ncbi:NAD(P)H-dependent oxidoreductase [Simiduia curdlanivorans]|uniref:NAD(P)H-dependent oxidoreductase n=1 Tax=Simiduia curdlanivorans TaxID=1492769 RepID=A0ABV8V8N5_9GAMM|nr:NAD(P)H-dependent oxidoreductase [Simiduia curdlanivorans]MDN3639392.1 NAD(P)H-dependent oxidoreductase [Simiduia curdlanivorans]